MSLLRTGQRIEDFDAAIAAHALATDAVLVTATLDDMVRVPGLRVEDWCGPTARRSSVGRVATSAREEPTRRRENEKPSRVLPDAEGAALNRAEEPMRRSRLSPTPAASKSRPTTATVVA